MHLFPIAAALTLAACGITQSLQHFVLPDNQYIRPAMQGSEIAIKVSLIELLASGSLVYQADAYHVSLAKNHLWVASPDGALATNLSNKLSRLNPRHTFVPASRSQSGRTLKIYIEALRGNYQRQTTVSGYALWPDGRNEPFDTTTPQQGDGYTAVLESLENGLGKVTQAVAH